MLANKSPPPRTAHESAAHASPPKTGDHVILNIHHSVAFDGFETVCNGLEVIIARLRPLSGKVQAYKGSSRASPCSRPVWSRK